MVMGQLFSRPMTSSPAAALARMRWAGLTPPQRAAHIAKMVKARKKQAKALRKTKGKE